jgi:hypothetical protein
LEHAPTPSPCVGQEYWRCPHERDGKKHTRDEDQITTDSQATPLPVARAILCLRLQTASQLFLGA